MDFENTKVPNRNFTTKSVFDQCGFSNSAVCWGPKNRTNRGIPVVGSSRYPKNTAAKFTHSYIPSLCKEFFVMRHNLGHSTLHDSLFYSTKWSILRGSHLFAISVVIKQSRFEWPPIHMKAVFLNLDWFSRTDFEKNKGFFNFTLLLQNFGLLKTSFGNDN